MSLDQYTERYYTLCDRRDAVNAANAPLEAQLEQVNARINELQAQALALASQIDDNRGREKWLDLKREIRFLAVAMGNRIPPRPGAVKAA